jgi:twitching motility protein PilT
MPKISLPSLLKTMVEQNASDLHITVGVPPQFRISGKMVRVKTDSMGPQDTKELCYQVLTDSQKSEFERNLELDFSFGIKDISRFRGNLFLQRGSVAAVFRRIPISIPDWDAIGIPKIMREVIKRPSGLVLVTGPTGSGKSTTLASILDTLNREEYGHLMTIEDPIEFVHPHKNCVVNQREVGVDTKSFHNALRQILRQDPDFILVGEMRDVETIEMALTMAETGHLVFGTLHTNGAIQTINRVINVFPPHQQAQVRQLLSFTLQAVISQALLPKADGKGRAMACEVLIPTMAIRNLIREEKIHQIYSAMQTGQGETGMQTMNQHLLSLIRSGMITREAGIEFSNFPEELLKQISLVK